jgi:hypothetical protein
MRFVLQGSLVLALATFVRVPSAMVRGPLEPPPVARAVEAMQASESFLVEAGSEQELEAEAPRTDAVVIVVLDGARWQEVLVGTDPRFAVGSDRDVLASAMMPSLHALIAEGAVIGAPDYGVPMVASGPNFVSLPGYTEIFSGRSPFACFDNECAATRLPTIVDEVRATSSDVAVFSSWSPILRAAALHPSDILRSTGEDVTGAFRADRATADRALAYFAERRPTFMFLGLGEPDEFAHRGDYAGYIGSLRQADAILGELRSLVEQMGDRGRRTSIFVTCDHGRSDDFQDHGAPWPESQRVWLVASGGAIPARGFVYSERRHRLADIAPTIRALLGLPFAPLDAAAGVGEPIDALLPSP